MKIKPWIKQGIFWGVFMFISMNIILPVFNDEAIRIKTLIFSFFYWILGGLITGKLIEKIHRKSREEAKKQFDQLDEGIENIDYMPDNEPESYDKKKT